MDAKIIATLNTTQVEYSREGRDVNKCTHKGCRTTAPCRFEVYGARFGEAAKREALIRAGEEGGSDFPPQTFPV